VTVVKIDRYIMILVVAGEKNQAYSSEFLLLFFVELPLLPFDH